MPFYKSLESFYKRDHQAFIHQPALLLDHLRKTSFTSLEEQTQYHQISTMLSVHNFIEALYQTSGERTALVNTLLHLASRFTKAGLTPFTYGYILYAVMHLFGYKTDTITWINPLDKSFKNRLKVTHPSEIGFGTKHESLDDFQLSGSTLVKYLKDRRIVYIPYHVKTIDVEAFKGCQHVQTIIMGDTVKTIKEGAFSGCIQLENIVLSSKITKIENHVFEGCQRLSNLDFIEHIETIGDFAFAKTAVTSFDQPPKCKHIGDHAFFGCSALVTVNLDERINFIGQGVFKDCPNLTDLSVPFLGKTKKDKQTAHLNYLLTDADGTPSTSQLKNLSISHVPYLAEGAFKDASYLEHITLHTQALTTVVKQAFEGCTALKSVGLNAAIQTLETACFKGCFSLETLDIDLSQLQRIESSAFYDCQSLPRFPLNSGLKTIGDSAFYHCLKWTDIDVPSSVDMIGEQAFGYIPIQSLSLPFIGASNHKNESLTSLTHLFAKKTITGFKNVHISETCSYANPPGLKQVIVRGGSIYEDAFHHAISLQEITLESGVKDIAPGAFYQTLSLKGIHVIDHARYIELDGLCIDQKRQSLMVYPSQKDDMVYQLPKTIKHIAPYAFNGNTYLTEIVLPPSVKTIGDYAFSDCPALYQMELSKTIKHLGRNIFKGCSDLHVLSTSHLSPTPPKKETLTFKDFFTEEDTSDLSLRTLRVLEGSVNGASFEGMSSLKEIILEKDVTQVTQDAMKSSAIDSVTIKCSFEALETSCFDDINLNYLTIDAIPKEVEPLTDIFKSHPKLLTLHILSGDISHDLFAHIDVGELRLSSSVQSIEKGAFNEAKCGRLIIENDALVIAKQAFFNAYIEDIVLPDTSPYIFDQNCLVDDQAGLMYLSGSLEEVMRFPNHITKIYSGAINHAFQSQMIEFHSGIIQVEASSILNCPFIHSLKIACDIDALDPGFMPDNKITTLHLDMPFIKGPLSSRFKHIDHIVVGQNTVAIGASAFHSLETLKTINLPDSLDHIGHLAFSQCRALEEVSLPSNIKYIGLGIFDRCVSLKKVTLPYINPCASMRQPIGSFGSFFGRVAEQGLSPLEVTFTDTQSKSYFIPDALSEVIITGGSLTQGCFSGWHQIENLEIKQFKGDIPPYAFKDCRALKTITLNEDTRSIEDMAFSGCNQLTRIDNLETIEKIAPTALAGCDQLTSLSFGPSIKTIPIDLLNNCGGLQSITVTNNPYYLVRGGMLIERALNKLIYCPKVFKHDSVMIEGVEIIGQDAFSHCDTLVNVICTAPLKTIEPYGFRHMTHLKSLHLPDSVESMHPAIFEGCLDLQELTLPFIGASEDCTNDMTLKSFFGETPIQLTHLSVLKGSLHTDAFKDSASLKTVDLKEIESLPSGLFKDLKGLEEVTLSPHISRIEKDAFKGCDALKTISLEHIKHIEESAFSGCFRLESIECSQVESLGDFAFFACHQLGQVSPLKAIRHLGQAVFKDCQSLQDIAVTGPLETLGQEVFYGCLSLVSLDIPFIGPSLYDPAPLDFLIDEAVQIKEIVLRQGPTTDGQFKDISTLEKVSIMGDTLTLHTDVFSNCTHLRDVTVSDSIELIGERAFKGCDTLKTLKLPDGVLTLAKEAFSGCLNLESLTLPPSLQKIEDQAFKDCSHLESLNIPDVTTIGETILEGCVGIRNLDLPFLGNGSKDYQTLTYLFKDVNKDLKHLHIRAGQVDPLAFLDHVGLEEVVLPLDLGMIPSGAFKGCTALKEMTLPPHVSKIEKEAFKGCEALSTISGLNWVDDIDQAAFKDCLALKEVVLSQALKHLKIACFEGCRSLETVTLSPLLETIEDRTFSGCSTLKYILFPQSLKRIGTEAFKGCASLERVDIQSVDRIEDYAFLDCDKELKIMARDPQQVEGFGACWDYNKYSLKDETKLFKKLSNQLGKKHKIQFKMK